MVKWAVVPSWTLAFMWIIPKHPCRSCTPQDKAFCHTIKTVHDQPDSPDLILMKQLWDVLIRGCHQEGLLAPGGLFCLKQCAGGFYVSEYVHMNAKAQGCASAPCYMDPEMIPCAAQENFSLEKLTHQLPVFIPLSLRGLTA